MKLLIALLFTVTVQTTFASSGLDSIKTIVNEDGCDGACFSQTPGTPTFKEMGNLTDLMNHGAVRKFAAKGEDFPDAEVPDPRMVADENAPEWMNAVGKLTVPGFEGKNVTNCTASLVSDNENNDSNILTTAGHCVRDWISASGRKSGPAIFKMKTKDGRVIEKRVKAIINMKNTPQDYAILELEEVVKNSDVKPLVVSKWQHHKLMRNEKINPVATMAGYSRDAGMGAKGENLTYHEGCDLANVSGGVTTSTTCHAYPGASGGPTVVTATNKKGERKALFVGVVEGGAHDSTRFTHHSLFYKPLMKAIKENR